MIPAVLIGDEPKHCDHECVCNWWACNANCEDLELDTPCHRKGCNDDTRARGPVEVKRQGPTPSIYNVDGIWRIPVEQDDTDYPGAKLIGYRPIPIEIIAAIRAEAAEQSVSTIEELKMANGMLEAEIDRLEDINLRVSEQARKEERKWVCSFIRDFVSTHIPDGDCPFGKMNSVECLSIRDGQCEVCIIDHAIESLRTNPADSGGEAGAKGGDRE